MTRMKKLNLLSSLLLISALFTSIQAQGDCDIFDLVTEAHPCENGTFLVDVDFEVENPQGDTFGILGNATNYGIFLYEDLPVTIGPLTADDETEWIFIVYDFEEPDCNEVDTLGIVTCCGFDDIVIDPLECLNQEVFSATLDLTPENTGNLGFDVFTQNGNSLGFFLYNDLPVTVNGIPSNGNDPVTITICDNDNETCCTEVTFEGLDCDPSDCEIWDVIATAGECEDGDFEVTIAFNFENVSDQFTVMGNGNNYGTFSYNDVPVTIGPLDGDGETVYEFVVKDIAIDGCMDFAVIEPILCPEPCGFHDIVVDPGVCLGDDAYSLYVDFIPVSTGDDGFVLYSADQELGTFSYEDLPVELDSFPSSGDFFDTLVICDVANPDCCDTLQFQALQCSNCIIYDVVAEALPCDSNMQFMVVLDFEYQNVSDEGFQVGGNGNTYGEWDYTDLPITLGPFDGDDETEYEFVVIDLGGGLCLAGTELGTVNCIDPCMIWDLTADPFDCTGDGTYDLLIDFNYANGDSMEFEVRAGDVFVGAFGYDELPVIIIDFPSSGNPNDVVTVCDLTDFDCCATLEFDSPGCFPECDIRDLVVDPLECTSDSTFSLIVDFIHEDLPTDSVDLSTNGVFLGRYSVNDLPFTVTNFPAQNGVAPLVVCASEEEACCEDIEFEALICDSTCAIFDIVVDDIECYGDDGFFSMWIDFEFVGVDNDFFEVWSDTTYLGLYEFDDLPVQVDGIPGTGEMQQLLICQNDNDDCCQDLWYEAPDCDFGECDLYDVVVDGIACSGDETYSMWVNFEYENPGNSFFEMWSGDDYLGFYALDSLPVFVDDIPANGGNEVLLICINDNDDCCVEYEYEEPECIEECMIWDVSIGGLECAAGEETFSMFLNFNYQGVENDFFEVWNNEEYLGLYSLDSLPVALDGIPGTGETALLEICINDQPDCCTELEYLAPFCASCSIFDLTVEPVMCTSDSTFSAWIDFEHEGLDSNGVDIYAGDNYLGFFPLVTPVLVPNLPAGEGGLLVSVCSADTFPEALCCASVEIEALECMEPPCPIGTVTAEATECDSNGMFEVILNIELLTGDADGGFLVAGNGNTYGSFDYSDLPITIGPLEGDSMTAWEFIAIDLANTECSNFVELGIIDCGSSGLFGPSAGFQPLEIRYGPGGPFMLVPEEAETATLWTISGQPVAQMRALEPGSLQSLANVLAIPGMYIVTIDARSTRHVGKVVVAGQ